ncbi:MAG: hypothetical protein JWR67_1675 [Mucilaginibacter sp.]|nr:hypothetical protein [Mucilaginibacter sp.]
MKPPIYSICHHGNLDLMPIFKQTNKANPCKIKYILILLSFVFISSFSYSQDTPATVAHLTAQLKLKNTELTKAKDSIKGQLDTIKNIKKELQKLPNPNSTASTLTVIAIGLLCLVTFFILVYTSLKSPKNEKEALGLPEGSIRALIALIVIVFYILVSLALVYYEGPTPTTLATDVTKTLGTLVVAISAFYFGSKTAEQSGKAIAAAAAANQATDMQQDVSMVVIQQAIASNKQSWMTLYNCLDILPGKKKVQGTTTSQNCIIFKVAVKPPPPGTTPIPAIINYESNGITYSIPTDVQ